MPQAFLKIPRARLETGRLRPTDRHLVKCPSSPLMAPSASPMSVLSWMTSSSAASSTVPQRAAGAFDPSFGIAIQYRCGPRTRLLRRCTCFASTRLYHEQIRFPVVSLCGSCVTSSPCLVCFRQCLRDIRRNGWVLYLRPTRCCGEAKLHRALASLLCN